MVFGTLLALLAAKRDHRRTAAPGKTLKRQPVSEQDHPKHFYRRCTIMNTGDTAWVLISSVLVLGMTIPGTRLFLRRSGAKEKRPVRLNAMFHHRLRHQPAVGPVRLLPGLRTGYGSRDHRQPEMGGAQLRRRTAERGLCGNDPASGLYDLSGDVRHHHAGPDHRRLCGTDEVFGLSDLHRPVGDPGLRSPGALGLGNRRLAPEPGGAGFRRRNRRPCQFRHLGPDAGDPSG